MDIRCVIVRINVECRILYGSRGTYVEQLSDGMEAGAAEITARKDPSYDDAVRALTRCFLGGR